MGAGRRGAPLHDGVGHSEKSWLERAWAKNGLLFWSVQKLGWSVITELDRLLRRFDRFLVALYALFLASFLV